MPSSALHLCAKTARRTARISRTVRALPRPRRRMSSNTQIPSRLTRTLSRSFRSKTSSFLFLVSLLLPRFKNSFFFVVVVVVPQPERRRKRKRIVRRETAGDVVEEDARRVVPLVVVVVIALNRVSMMWDA